MLPSLTEFSSSLVVFFSLGEVPSEVRWPHDARDALNGRHTPSEPRSHFYTRLLPNFAYLPILSRPQLKSAAAPLPRIVFEGIFKIFIEFYRDSPVVCVPFLTVIEARLFHGVGSSPIVHLCHRIDFT